MIGYQAGYSSIAPASNNLFIGGNAGYRNTIGSGNLFLGNNAGYLNTVANSSTIVGYQAGYSGGGYASAILGYQAGYSLTTATGSVAVGYQALYPVHRAWETRLRSGSVIFEHFGNWKYRNRI